ncbi:endophilin-A [Exophiala viscosa]|uniref:Endophilin-A n=1 Tax=Exophiala viscosa TaxID=2486360 RepID=A0AAN6E5L7_9EURO|nr:endophilin-A [Exophiala viscosa]
MNVNKKLDRFKQWAGERMGGEVKTSVSDDFKALEVEMGLRQEGLDKMQKSMNAYVKAISKRSEVEDKEKTLPIAYMGGTMISHGEDFEPDSEFGQCLTTFGRTQERLARAQEVYIASATSSWLESLERSSAQMKEFQAARKRLDSRRLAYDTSLAKMQKAKKEDFRVEEELRNQKVKYEESADDVQRRMEDIRDADPEMVADLGTFLDAELAYHDKCRETLLQLKSEWPARSQPQYRGSRPNPLSRSNTVRSYAEPVEEPSPIVEVRPSIRSGRAQSARFGDQMHEYSPGVSPRPNFARSTTYDPVNRDMSPANMGRMARVPSDSLMIRTARSQLRNVEEQDVFADDSGSYTNSSPDHGYGDLATSPATSHGSGTLTPVTSRKSSAPPPPPPSRAKKPPPPPVPAKRSVLT